jgi:hypothetical protein
MVILTKYVIIGGEININYKLRRTGSRKKIINIKSEDKNYGI